MDVECAPVYTPVRACFYIERHGCVLFQFMAESLTWYTEPKMALG